MQFAGPSKVVLSVTPIATANINPLPAKAGRYLSPAGAIGVVVDRTTKSEREEVAVAEPIMEVVEMVVAPLTVPPLDISARDRPCGHRASRHRRGGHWAGSIKGTGGHEPTAHRAWAWSSSRATRHPHRASTAADTATTAASAVSRHGD